MIFIERFIEKIPELKISNGRRMWIGVLLIIPMYFIPWFLSLPVGVLSTYLGKYLEASFLGEPLLRLWQMFIFYVFGRMGLKLILGRHNLGFSLRNNWGNDVVIGFLVGGGSVLLTFIIMLFTGLVHIKAFAGNEMSFVSFIIGFIAAIVSNLGIGFIEEIPFRGYLVQIVEDGLGKFWAVVGSGLIFAFWHLPFSSLDSLDQVLWLSLELIPMGLLLSWVFVKTHSLWLVIGLHSSYNFMQQALDMYGRYASNENWGNFIFLGTSTHGSQILVGTPEGTAGLMQLVSSLFAICAMGMYVSKNRKNKIFYKS